MILKYIEQTHRTHRRQTSSKAAITRPANHILGCHVPALEQIIHVVTAGKECERIYYV